MSKTRHKYSNRRDDSNYYEGTENPFAQLRQQKSKREERRMLRTLKTKNSKDRSYDDDYYGEY